MSGWTLQGTIKEFTTATGSIVFDSTPAAGDLILFIAGSTAIVTMPTGTQSNFSGGSVNFVQCASKIATSSETNSYAYSGVAGTGARIWGMVQRAANGVNASSGNAVAELATVDTSGAGVDPTGNPSVASALLVSVVKATGSVTGTTVTWNGGSATTPVKIGGRAAFDYLVTTTIPTDTKAVYSIGGVEGIVAYTEKSVIGGVGIASAEALGTAATVPVLGSVGIASAEALGTAATVPVVTGVGIASAEALGTASLAYLMTPQGIASAEAFGTAVAVPVFSPAGIATAEALGVASLATGLLAQGIPSAEAFGVARLADVLFATGMGSVEALGVASLADLIRAQGIPSAETLGTAKLLDVIAAHGISPSEALGLAFLVPVILSDGIAGEEAFGLATVSTSGTTVPHKGTPKTIAYGDSTVVRLVPSLQSAARIAERLATRLRLEKGE